MKEKRRVYTAEFRSEALHLLKSSGKRVSEIEEELGIRAGLLYKWEERYGEGEARKTDSGQLGIRELEAEVRRLKRENAILQEEREILKKAVTLFSREQR
jgi:transposase